MDINICRNKCIHNCSRFMLHKENDEWFLRIQMRNTSNFYDYAYLPVEINLKELKKSHAFFRDINTIDLTCHEYGDENFNINNVFKYIYMKTNDICPCSLEHSMSDIMREKRIEDWKKKQKIKKKLRKKLVKNKKNDIL